MGEVPGVSLFRSALAASCLWLPASAEAQSIPLSPTAQASGAVITRDQGIEFVTVAAPGGVANAPWVGQGSATGRGSVGYDFRIGRFEVTTAQWVEFFNAALDRPEGDRLPHVARPSAWGAVFTAANNPGGQRFSVPAGNELRPVGNISWRMAAMYCNWLHNEKSSDREAFLNGAYDVSTFTYIGNQFQDQFTHNPGARYWIPTWDEWIKAAHYDPNRHGPGQGGYWTWSTTSETTPIYGPPEFGGGGITQANGAWDSLLFPGFNPFSIPLGAYPTVQSPWGLLDTAGGTSEWTEDVLQGGGGQFGERYRRLDGSAWNTASGSFVSDRVRSPSGEEFPSISIYSYGFRIASSVPTPGTGCVLLAFSLLSLRRRRQCHDPFSQSLP